MLLVCKSFHYFQRGITLNPFDFNLYPSNFSGSIQIDAIFDFEYNGQNGIIYYQNDGNGGNFSPLGDGSVDDEVIYNDYLIFDSDFDGFSNATLSVYDFSSSTSSLSAEGDGLTDCSQFAKPILPFFEPNGKEMNHILRGNFIDNDNSDIAYLINNESMIGFA